MPDIPFATRAYRRTKGNLPEFRLVNMLVEQSASAGSGMALIGREGLNTVATWGTGAVHGVWQQDGVFDGDRFALIGNTFYREGVSLGTVDGYGAAWCCCSPVEVVVGRGQTAYSYDVAETFEAIDFPDNAAVLWGVYLGTLFFFVRGGDAPQNNRFYFSAVLDARDIDDLDFAAAELMPDELLQLLVVGDNLAMLGSNSIEMWRLTGELALPVSRISQRLYRDGIKATGAAIAHDNSVVFVSSENRVQRLGEVAEVISDRGLEERIADSSTARMFNFNHLGHPLACVRLDQGSWLYDSSTQEWPEFQTLGRANWRANCAVMVGGTALLGDDTEGKLLEFSGHQDDGVDVERLCTAYFPIPGGSQVVDSIEIEANPGSSQELSGEGDDPIVEMRASNSRGNRWTPWRGQSFGQQGEYRRRLRWRRCGFFDSPGAMFEFRMSDPAPFRISRVGVNEPAGGRGR